MTTYRFRSVLACMTAVFALSAISVAPALADHKGETHGQKTAAEENFQEADNSASEDRSASEERDSGKPSKGSSTTTTSSESTTTTQSQSTTTDDGADGPGKNWDNEGTERGKSSTQCENTHGGTGSGRVYDSTCDGVASKAGNGSGGAGGRPCAGCVGNADYKEPKGQLNDGDHDGDAGYECDGNNGVARSNPAHTSCKRPATTEVCPPGTDLAGLPIPSTGCDLGVNELCPPGTDLAGRPPGPNGCDQVLGRIDKVCPEDSELAGREMTDLKDCVLGTRFHGTPDEPLGAILPFTGSSGVSLFISIGFLLMGAGAVSLRLRKSA